MSIYLLEQMSKDIIKEKMTNVIKSTFVFSIFNDYLTRVNLRKGWKKSTFLRQVLTLYLKNQLKKT